MAYIITLDTAPPALYLAHAQGEHAGIYWTNDPATARHFDTRAQADTVAHALNYRGGPRASVTTTTTTTERS